MSNKTEEAYVEAVKVAMDALDIRGTNDANQALIYRGALEKIAGVLRKNRYYMARGGKYTEEGALNNILVDRVTAKDFTLITENEFLEEDNYDELEMRRIQPFKDDDIEESPPPETKKEKFPRLPSGHMFEFKKEI